MVDEKKEERKAELARALLAGQASLIADEVDVFDGLSPEEIQEYVSQQTQGASSADPFEVRPSA